MIIPIQKSNKEMSEIMDVKSFQYIPVDMLKNSLYQELSSTFLVWVGVNGNDGFYNIINSVRKDYITIEILKLLVDKYYPKSNKIIFTE